MNNKENTFRQLSDKPLLITSAWCYFGFHSWTQWATHIKESEFSTRIYQIKTCVHCNKSIKRNIEEE